MNRYLLDLTFLLYLLRGYVGFKHVIEAQQLKAADDAKKFEGIIQENGLGFEAPGISAPGKDCVAWIKKFTDEKMQLNPDGQWVFVVDAITRTWVKQMNARVRQWLANNSSSYAADYNRFIGTLANSINSLPR